MGVRVYDMRYRRGNPNLRLKSNPRRPNIVDQLREGEKILDELLPLVQAKNIPLASTYEGKQWRSQGEGTRIRKQIRKLTNRQKYPQGIVARAHGLLRIFDNSVVLQGHDRWWVTDKAPKRK